MFHVVAITTRAYHRVASYEARAEALEHILKRRTSSFSYVLRDGSTGKRYTVNECEQMEKAA